MKQRILSILVDNTAGVLGRIAGMFSRRGYNIDSLTVGVTADPRYSRMTVVCSGDDDVLEQITKQLNKLVDVRDIKILEPDASVIRELILISGKQTECHIYRRDFPCKGCRCVRRFHGIGTDRFKIKTGGISPASGRW